MKIQYLDETWIKDAADLYISVFSEEPWNEVYDSHKEVEDFIKKSLSENVYISFIALENETLIGLCLGMKKPWIKGFEYYINEFCIKTDKQGNGLGSSFLAAIEKEITQMDMNSVILNTEKGIQAEGFYLKNGFKQLANLIVLGK